MRKKVLAVVTAAVLALGCFASVSAKNTEVADASLGLTIVTKSETKAKGTFTWADAKAAADKNQLFINGVKANSAQRKAVRAIDDNKIFTTNNLSLDYTDVNADDYNISAIGWDYSEKLTFLTHLYAQAGTEKVVRVFEITAPDADSANPVTAKIVDSDIKASKNYGLRHLKDGVWDNTTGKVTSVVNGVVTASLTGGSPFALVEVAKKDATDATGAAAAKAATTTKTAPKTGEV